MLARLSGAVIRYELDGPREAPVITFSHSLASALELWDLQVPVLRDRYRLLRYDTRGHGNSSVPPGPYSMEMLAADVIALLDHLGIEKTHFVGISMGGMIGQVLGCRYPGRIEKLIISSTTGRVPPEAGPLWEERIQAARNKGMGALAPGTLQRWLSEEFRRTQPEITKKINHMILNTPIDGYEGCSRAISAFDILQELQKMALPTLIIAGEKDESAPPSAAEQIRGEIRGSVLTVMPGALHLTNIETADLFNRTMTNFLA